MYLGGSDMSAFSHLAASNVDDVTLPLTESSLRSRRSHQRIPASRTDCVDTEASHSATASFILGGIDTQYECELPKIFLSRPSSRTTIGLMLEKAISSPAHKKALIALEGEAAQRAVDDIQNWLDSSKEDPLRRKAISILVKLAARSGVLPKSLFVEGITLQSMDPVSIGGFADVYKGLMDGQVLALKRLRITVSRKEREKMYQQFCREALVWRQLAHTHILTFKGVDQETFKNLDVLCMVSPWLEQGNLLDYLEKAGPVVEIRNRMLAECTAGIEYLHSQSIIHGDIRGSNILVDAEHHVRIVDFGLVGFSGDSTGARLFTATRESGSFRYMAPELHDPERYGEPEFRRTCASDVYSFGGLCIEVYTGKAPFADIRSDYTVMQHVMAGRRLPRPSEEQCRGAAMSYGLYSLISRCMEMHPSARITMRQIAEYWVVDDLVSLRVATSPEHAEITSQVEKMLCGERDLLEEFEITTISGLGSKDSPEGGEVPPRALLSSVQVISFAEDFLERRPEGHPDRPRTQNHLGNFLMARYIQTGDLVSLGDALHFFREALQLTPSGHPDRYLCHIYLSRVYSQKGTEHFDLQVSVSHLASAVMEYYGSARERLTFGLHRLNEIGKLLLRRCDGRKMMYLTLLGVQKQTKYLLRQCAHYLGIRTHQNIRGSTEQKLERLYRVIVDLTTHGSLASDHPTVVGIGSFEQHWAVSLISLLKSPSVWRIVSALRGVQGMDVINLMQQILDTWEYPLDHAIECSLRATILEVMVQLAQSIEYLPDSIRHASPITDTMALVDFGSFGDIYRGTHRGSNVAIKRPRRLEGARENPDFIREVLLISNIRHPHILPVFGTAHVPWSSNPCLIMPWMANGTVLSYLSTHRHDAIRLLFQVAQAVAFMHDLGIVHADLRGDNILVDEDGHARLADFGLATFVDATVVQSRGTYIENAHWTAPELLCPVMFGRDADDYRPTRATDIHSFGCLCWELYTLRKPFGTGGRAVMRFVHMHPERPTAARDGLDMPTALWDLVLRCWSADVAARPTMEAVTTLLGTTRERASLAG